MNEQKMRHLEVIQSVITRFSANCFLIKGWCVTLVVGFFALADSDVDRYYFILAYLPLVLFAFLDGYYLWLERRFRALYDHVRASNTESDFSLDTRLFKSIRGGYLGAMKSGSVFHFYFTSAFLTFLIMLRII